MDIEQMAAGFAAQKHFHQRRWDGITPYFTHVEAVAQMVALRERGSLAIAAAYLHDVVEDCAVTLDELAEMGFPRPVVDMVDALSRRKGETAIRYIMRLVKTPDAIPIKLADIEHNLSTSHPTKNRTIRDKWMLCQYILEEHQQRLELIKRHA